MKYQKNRSFILTFVMAFAVLFTLSACEQAAIINDNVMKQEREADEAISTISPDANYSSPLQIDSTPWYGSEAVPMKGASNLPPKYTGSSAITLTFTGTENFATVARNIQSVTGIPVTVSNSIFTSTPTTSGATTFTPAGGQEVSGGRIVWSGPLQDLLNQISNNFGSEWSYEAGQIRFTSEMTKTFMLNALANELTLTGSTSSTGGSSGATSNVPEIEIDGTTTLEIWGEISEAISGIIGDQGKASFSPSTGTVTVTSRPDVMRRVENYLRYQNEMRLRRVAVSVKVISVQTTDTADYSVDISGAIKAALGDSLTVAGVGNGDAGLSVSILKDPARSGNLAATLEATEGIERASIVHSGSLVTLSDQPAPLQVGRQIAYLERVSASGDDTGSVSLEPGSIDVGLFMTVLPRIVDGDRILMRLSMAITDADPNFRTFGSGDIQIELPEIETTGFLQNAVVSNGETLVLAGFEKRQNTVRDTTNPLGFLFGGSRSTNRGRQMLVLLINSRILPEQPLTVIAQ